jgi:hypothetical protein
MPVVEVEVPQVPIRPALEAPEAVETVDLMQMVLLELQTPGVVVAAVVKLEARFTVAAMAELAS